MTALIVQNYIKESKKKGLGRKLLVCGPTNKSVVVLARRVISYMNNRSVAYTRAGKIDEGINSYKKTLDSIPSSKKEFVPLVRYNLALAYARNDMLDEALAEVELVLEFEKSKVKPKGDSPTSEHGSEGY